MTRAKCGASIIHSMVEALDIELILYIIYCFLHRTGRRGGAGKMAVVVSAMGGKPKVTDLLLESVSLAAAGNLVASKVCETVGGRVRTVVGRLQTFVG